MAFGETALLQQPTISEAQSTTGRVTKSFTYTDSDDPAAVLVPCRFFELAASAVARQEGQALRVDAIAHVQAANYTVEPEGTTNTSGQRRQVRIKETSDSEWVLWEVVNTRNLGGLGRKKEISLRRWKQ